MVRDHKHGKKLIARWKVPYMKGSLRAIAYDDDGGVIAEDETTSFGDAVTFTKSSTDGAFEHTQTSIICPSLKSQYGNICIIGDFL